ncbi:MAG: peptidylprolyl isomerase [Candidatus Woesearchaeota archaeon]|nr:MAG: peptidylprolyl isomerase [Candidatus Woesearchaeota archaeon]
MVKIKEGDWIELDFIGRVKRTGQIFDLTKEDVAKKEGIYQEQQEYKPLKVRIGSQQLLNGLDKAMIGKEVGKSFKVIIKPEEAFGRRNPKLIQLTSLAKLKKKGVNPVPGMPLNIDGAMAYVRAVSGGRVILDFNHPLSGKELEYEVYPIRLIEKTEEKVKSIASLLLNLEDRDYDIKVTGEELELKFKKDVPKNIQELFKKQLINQISEIKKVNIVSKSRESKKTQKEEDKSKKK